LSLTGFQRRRRELAKKQVKQEISMEDLPVEEIKEKYTAKEIKARLDEIGIEYKSNATKDELIELLRGANNGD
jgi:transposase